MILFLCRQGVAWVLFLLVITVSVSTVAADNVAPLCPLSGTNPGGSAVCGDASPGGPPLKHYCAGPCSGTANAVTCAGYLTGPTGNHKVCSGCCPAGSTCCAEQGSDPNWGPWETVTGCCPPDQQCCQGVGCVKRPELCCQGPMKPNGSFLWTACNETQSCCHGSCCDEGEVCQVSEDGLHSWCCKSDRACGSSCCDEGEQCFGGTNCGPTTECTYLGVDLSPLASENLGNDTYVFAHKDKEHSSYNIVNPCGPLRFAHRRYTCYDSSMVCFGTDYNSSGDVRTGKYPPEPYRDSQGRLALYTHAYQEGMSFKTNITFVCSDRNELTYDPDSSGSSHHVFVWLTNIDSVCKKSATQLASAL